VLIVQCDFDDTVTVGNVSSAIREVFATGDWRSIEAAQHAGKIGVEQANIRQFAMVRASQKQIEDFVMGDVVIRYAFDQLGLEGLEVYSGHAEVTPEGVHVSYTDPLGAALNDGFKESYARWLKRDGDTLVYVGDGQSDIQPANEADFVIARSTLAEHREGLGLPCYTFETFDDVGKHIEEIRKQVST
jgi:2-hydroxy-3-keto-5-methylthiopentenyl-1-phosphate phosphatase